MIEQRTELGEPRLFYLQRDEDVSGTSGPGRVADGVQWPDGSVSMRWRSVEATFVEADCIERIKRIHGHDGKTRVMWA